MSDKKYATCGVCGSKVIIRSGDEGTGYFEPLSTDHYRQLAIDAVMKLPARGDMRRMAIQAIDDAFSA